MATFTVDTTEPRDDLVARKAVQRANDTATHSPALPLTTPGSTHLVRHWNPTGGDAGTGSYEATTVANLGGGGGTAFRAGDNDLTWYLNTHGPRVVYDLTLTAPRTVTLQAVVASGGAAVPNNTVMTVTRSGVFGDFVQVNNHNGGSLKSMGAWRSATFIFVGGNWFLSSQSGEMLGSNNGSDFVNPSTVLTNIGAAPAVVIQANISGAMSSPVSGRTWFPTGNVTAIPITAGWIGVFRNKSGSNKTLTPASGTCIVGEAGTTAASVTIANNKSVSVEGDGTNLWVDGDVV